jgi:pimeloyl-ACP methyl ester carboxylesterase
MMSTTSEAIQSSCLKLTGAQIYYEVQGSGPVLVMIPGGPTDAGIFAAVAKFLTDRYTVVRYDPRGNSRSVLDGPPVDQDLDVHGDDAYRLIEAMGNEPAFVLGSSGGAQIGLNLVARHRLCVSTLVAHEPPCMALLPVADDERLFIENVYNTYRDEGAEAAMVKFMAGAGIGGPPAQRAEPPSAETAEAFGRVPGNVDYFLAHGFRPISKYRPDVSALLESSSRVVVGVGETSDGSLPYRTSIALAERLGTVPVRFPGGHGGYNEKPAAFAERLHQVLSGA